MRKGEGHPLIRSLLRQSDPLLRRQLPSPGIDLLLLHVDVAHGAAEIAPGGQLKAAGYGQPQLRPRLWRNLDR